MSSVRAFSIYPPNKMLEVTAMPFSSLLRAMGQIDEQFVFAATVWLMAIFIAGVAFKKFARST